MYRLTLAVVLAMAAGCGASTQQVPGEPFADAGVRFTLTPSAARNCEPGTVYAGRLQWEVEGGGNPRLEIRLREPDGQLFARSNEARGSAETGEWVTRGMWFLLVDRSNGRVIAAQRAGPDRCD